MGALFYNKLTDTAFRVESNHFDTVWYKEVSTHEARAKMNATRKFIATAKLNEQIATGEVVKLQSAKTISRDINFIRAGKTPPVTETVKTGRKTKRSVSE